MREMKSIRFNTEEVRAILDGRKNSHRMPIKLDLGLADTDRNDPTYLKIPDKDGNYWDAKDLCRYQPGDIIWVRETWMPETEQGIPTGGYIYIASNNRSESDGNTPLKWRASIHMPKEAARIFLKITDVRVERLQDITDADCWHEGLSEIDELYLEAERYRDGGVRIVEGSPERCAFARLWNSTIKKKDLDCYGWETNPWVFVIEFEKLEVE